MIKRILVFTVCLVLVHLAVLGQVPNLPPAGASQIAKFFPAYAVGSASGGQSNVNSLVSGYITPVAEDFGSLASGGWYNTAATHKRFGFDLSVSINTISSTSENQYFPINNLQDIQYNGTVTSSGAVGAGGGKSPTVYGPESEFPTFTYTAGPNIIKTFVGPSGGNISKDIPIGSMAVPTITGGLGLFANTDLRFRFTPDVGVNKTTMGNWGVGLMHDIKQHIPGIKMAPLSLSLFLGYTQLTAKTDLSGIYENAQGSGSFSGQEGIGQTKNYTVQLLISKSIPVLTFYGGIGFNSSSTDYKINGSYYVDKAFIGYNVTVPLALPAPTITNPFSQSFSSSGVRFTGGIRFKFGPIILNTDYTYFNTKGIFSLGFGFTVH